MAAASVAGYRLAAWWARSFRIYEIGRPIGAGGMGLVHEAVHVRTGRRVAIKLLNATLLGGDDEWVARLHREARAAGNLSSEHIAQVIDAGMDGATGSPFMVMELLSGEDLSDVLSRAGNRRGRRGVRDRVERAAEPPTATSGEPPCEAETDARLQLIVRMKAVFVPNRLHVI